MYSQNKKAHVPDPEELRAIKDDIVAEFHKRVLVIKQEIQALLDQKTQLAMDHEAQVKVNRVSLSERIADLREQLTSIQGQIVDVRADLIEEQRALEKKKTAKAKIDLDNSKKEEEFKATEEKLYNNRAKIVAEGIALEEKQQEFELEEKKLTGAVEDFDKWSEFETQQLITRDASLVKDLSEFERTKAIFEQRKKTAEEEMLRWGKLAEDAVEAVEKAKIAIDAKLAFEKQQKIQRDENESLKKWRKKSEDEDNRLKVFSRAIATRNAVTARRERNLRDAEKRITQNGGNKNGD